MTSLTIASKANQAITLPIVVIAQYAIDTGSKAAIDIKYEEVDTLSSGDKAIVEVEVGSEPSKYGFKPVIESLSAANPFLQGENNHLVNRTFLQSQSSNINFTIGKGVAF